MTQKDIDWVNKMRYEHDFMAGRVLDIGSLNVNGEVRSCFPDASEYIGIDFREGDNVDIVMDAHDIRSRWHEDGYFNTVICLNTLEHDDAFWETLNNIRSILGPGGYLFFAIPTISFPIHDHPADYWRFTEQAVREIVFKGFEVLDLQTVYTKEVDGKPVNPVIQCFGRKT